MAIQCSAACKVEDREWVEQDLVCSLHAPSQSSLYSQTLITVSQRKRYLVDNLTGIVYERPATTASNVWPKVVGTWDRVRRVLTPKSTAARSGNY